MLTSNDKFNVNCAWEALRRRGSVQELLWQNRIPTIQVLVKIKIEIEVKYCCCNGIQQESFENLFVKCADAIKQLNMFAGAVGIECSVIQLKQFCSTWWKFECAVKLKPLILVVPSFIG
ncbi:hypothetical protein H5410_028280 [Solanum commersonii]|uniref:Uncharacterized protein n=1 Tax=Solanum commersonii TaxID=4109 RepID=A0A9J5Z5Q0_SOLCO|nr:hypothetical protein H5410_028280 [Solanum commersonii]